MTVKENVQNILRNLPENVILEAAAKGRPAESIQEAIGAGISIIGENYIQEAEGHYKLIGHCVHWHFIGHLQKNKVKKAVALFDMIETIDSVELAREIDSRCKEINKVMPVLIEINSGREVQKHGVFPENAVSLVTEISGLSHLRVAGLMTMGPVVADSTQLRACFIETRNLFENIKKLHLSSIRMEYLSMGMSDSYRMAIDEGANLIRIGRKIFA